MQLRYRWPLSVCLLLAVGSGTRAEKRAFIIDTAHSQINFVGEALFLSAHGYFNKWEADVAYDAENPENSSLSITIDTASLTTRVDRRDTHLRSADFFDAANFPKATFVATKIAPQDAKTLKVTGDLTIRGITRQVEIPVKTVFYKDGRGRFKGETEINRTDFGMKYKSVTNPVEETVAVQFDINIMDKAMMEERARQRQQQPPPAKPPLN